MEEQLDPERLASSNLRLFKRLLILLTLIVAVLVGFFAGQWRGHSNCDVYCGRVLVFERNASVFTKYVERLPADAQGNLSIPNDLQALGVIRIWVEDETVRFLLSKVYPDDADEIILYSRRREGQFINTFFTKPQNSTTYHIQYLKQPGWYFWMRN